MGLPPCKCVHKCADGGEGGCTQPEGHYGRHLCSNCLSFFSYGDSARLEPPEEVTAAALITGQWTEPKLEPDSGRRQTAGELSGLPGKRCEHTVLQLCPSCTSANCPDIAATCACCHTLIDRSIDRCAFCGGPLCPSCKEASLGGGVPCR